MRKAAGWSQADNAWAFAAPRVGWLCYIEDEGKLSVYKATGWSAGTII